ncbi:MAG: phenylalanine--tRNA ligase subunit alpha [Candidatus Gottesmanbacteria bacterium]
MKKIVQKEEPIVKDQLIRLLLTLQEDAATAISGSAESIDTLRLTWLGKNSEFIKLASSMRSVNPDDKQQIGAVLNGVKKSIESALHQKLSTINDQRSTFSGWFDTTIPGEKPPQGHLHIVSQAIEEITTIFNRLGFTRVRHPEIDWDWYAFTSLNMPEQHPARDEWETFFIDTQKKNEKFNKIVLTPHTSNGQVREMEKGNLPIRMINIAKCYRRQIDVSHTPMFHQFEGLYVDKNVSIAHLKGVLDYFAKHFFGKDRTTRIRPFHFQFTEPSFEIDISCGICGGRGCKLCKEGWLELGGAGMVHPVVLANGSVDTNIFNGFAFGWGVERAYMMKANTNIDDIRLLYGNDIRFLTQF